MASSFFCFTLLFISLFTADGFMYYDVERCVFNSTELNNIEYVRSLYCNKLEFLRFDSSVGRFVGFTELGVKNADRLNQDESLVAAAKAQKGMYCQRNVGNWYKGVLSKSARLSIRLRSTTPLSSHHPAMLVCSAYDFYPKRIKVSWLRDGQEVSSDVTSTEEMADGDWYYQTHSHLEYTPRSGEKISCVVEHASLKEPLRTDWDPDSQSSIPESDLYKFVIGASGLFLGLILCLGGFIYYKRKARGRILVSTN